MRFFKTGLHFTGGDLGISQEMLRDFALQPRHWRIEDAIRNMSHVGEMKRSLGHGDMLKDMIKFFTKKGGGTFKYY